MGDKSPKNKEKKKKKQTEKKVAGHNTPLETATESK